MKNKFFLLSILDEREEQLMNKAGAESFHITIVFLLLSYIIAILAPSLFNPTMILIINIIGLFYFFNRARNLGATYYSRFSFYDFGMSINDTTNHNYYNVAKLPVQYRDLSAQSIKLQIPFCLVLYLSLLSSLGLSWKPRFKELW